MGVDISGQVVLITGASSGIGAACAIAFAKEGCKLVLVARRAERLKELSEQIHQNKKDLPVHCLTMDMQDLDAVSKTLDQLPDEFKPIDILVNNAGLALGTSTAQELKIEDMATMVDTNIKGVMAMTRAIAPNMLERNSGHIINMSSIAGHEAYPNGSVYCATKHAVDAFTKALRHDVVATQVRVTAISPGAVETEFSVVRWAGDKDKASEMYKGIEPLVGADIADDVIYAATRCAMSLKSGSV